MPVLYTRRFIAIQAVGAALLASVWAVGWLTIMFAGDRTYMTSVIAAVLLIGVLLAGFERWQWVEWIVMALPIMGLLGTVIGIKIAVSGISGEEIALRDLGVATALNTTIAGMIGALWLGLTERLIR